jgi:molybdopterin-dependent oxidoreductase alpha subunit
MDKRSNSTLPVGGGAKKVLYTLKSVKRVGLKNAAKALTSHNACKACGLGMGGQRGGMTNEMDEFPSVCNKSVQAQITDIQPPIPTPVFNHSLAELRELDGHELEHLGRLGTPIYKPAGGDRYQPTDWDFALDHAAKALRATDPGRSFFYSSGRSSNEAGFLLQLLARLYGTNNVNNCSYYCHQATGVALGNTIGSGTSTVELRDLSGCDLIFVIGANPSSNHPRFIHQLKACRERGGEVIIINPAKEPGLVRFAVPKSAKSMLSGGTWIASDYLQPRIGTDIALFKGIAKAIFERKGADEQFIAQFTADFDSYRRDIEQTRWDEITASCGIERPDIDRVAGLYCQANHAVFAWGMGMTHHKHGVANVEQISNLALLRGMVGKRFAGLLPLRGHSNVQGIGTIGVKPVLSEDVFSKMEQELGVTLPREAGMDTMAAMQAAAAGNIDTAVIMGGNLYGASPDSRWAEQALNRVACKVFLTTTLNRGHVCGVDDGESLVLPVTARDEERQATTQESMFNYVRLSDGGIDRLDNVRSEVDILSDIGTAVVSDSVIDFSAFKSHRKVRQAIAKIVPGMEALASIDVAKKEFHIHGRLLHKPQFNTEAGRARFATCPIPPRPNPTPDDPSAFVLSTVRSEGQFNTIIYEYADSYRGAKSRWTVFMNRADMADHNITEADKVNLTSAQGRMDAVQVLAYDLPQGDMLAYFPEANVLTNTEVDPRSKTPAFKSISVKLEATG